MRNIKVFENNVNAYKHTIQESKKDENVNRVRIALYKGVRDSKYFTILEANEFNALGYFYFTEQSNCKKDVIYILFRSTLESGELKYYLSLGAKVKNLSKTPMVRLCEAELEQDFTADSLEELVLEMLQICGLNYEMGIKE